MEKIKIWLLCISSMILGSFSIISQIMFWEIFSKEPLIIILVLISSIMLLYLGIKMAYEIVWPEIIIEDEENIKIT